MLSEKESIKQPYTVSETATLWVPDMETDKMKLASSKMGRQPKNKIPVLVLFVRWFAI